jgi:hypothetical protein
MTIAVLCYSTGEVDIIRNVPNFKTEEEVDNFLFFGEDGCNYNPSEVSFMYPVGEQDIRINNLTPEDFG